MNPWIVTSPGPAGHGDGIADYAARLGASLGATVLGPGDPRPHAGEIAGILHQYSPHASSTDLRRWIAGMARQARPVVLTIHEFWPPPDGTVRRALRRFQLKRRVTRLGHAADAVVVTQEIAARELVSTGVVPRPPVVIPVGSNIACSATPGPRNGGIVIFGQPASYEPELLAAVDRWRRTITPVPRLTWISRSQEELAQAWRSIGDDVQDVSLLGALSEADVSAVLARATLGLAPYRGGASGRRTTLAALLEHGVPTVTIDGPAADQWARASEGVLCVDDPSPQRFVAAVSDVWHDAARLRALGAAGLRAHAARLTWPHIASAYRSLMTIAQEQRP